MLGANAATGNNNESRNQSLRFEARRAVRARQVRAPPAVAGLRRLCLTNTPSEGWRRRSATDAGPAAPSEAPRQSFQAFTTNKCSLRPFRVPVCPALETEALKTDS